MPTARWTIDRLADDVTELGRRALPRQLFFAEVTARLRRVFDSEAACWHTLDPQTRLITSDAPEELVSSGVFGPESVQQAGAKLIASEYFQPDVNTFAELAGRRVPVGILSRRTGGHPERSTRYMELLAPAGIPFEMRAAFVSRGRAWGAVHLARREHQHDFDVSDASALASVSVAIAEGIRTSLRFDAARDIRGGAAAPGLIVLGPGDEIELITPPARELLGAMDRRGGTAGTPPAAVRALAGFMRSRGRSDSTGSDAVAVPTSAGWITLHASLPEGTAGARVAVVLERSASPQSAALRLEADGVTAREREVATLLAQGLSNPEIARTMVISPYTVQDHIKNLFEKTRVSSRQELVARVFLDDYLPHLVQASPLTSSGTFS